MRHCEMERILSLFMLHSKNFIYLVVFLGRDPLPWPSRVQIALDSARGLEYIHEHTVPVYIHRDIKSANILIDKNFHGKVDLQSCNVELFKLPCFVSYLKHFLCRLQTLG